MKEGSLVGLLDTRDPNQVEIHKYNLVDFTNFPDNFYFKIVKN